MKSYYLIFLSTFFFLPHVIFAANTVSNPEVSLNCAITATLRVGSISEQVKCLQSIVGANADGHFGPLTKASVVFWQSNHGLSSDGIVGPLTRASLFKGKIGGLDEVSSVANAIYPPRVFSVYPEKVRAGDNVKIYGENFASAGNTVRLRYGQIEDRFENLASSDGKTISFVYQPPDVKTMNKEELSNLPPMTLKKISDALQIGSGSFDDIVAPYRNMRNEDDLRQFLNNNGHNFDELYDKFWVTIENSYGRGSSKSAILTGLRKFSIGSNSALSKDNFIFSIFDSLSKIFTPQKVYAQTPEGGYNSGVIFYCTCGSGYMTYMTDFSSNGGTGDYYWAPGFVPTVGTPFISGPQLGFFIQNAGTCVIIVGNSCSSITANVASLPWGEAL